MGKGIIIAFGDSTTAYRDTIRQVYTERLAARLLSEMASFEIVNSGIPKNNTNDARKRFAEDVLKRNPDIAIIQFGINDSAVDVLEGKKTPRVPLSDYIENLEFFIEELHKINCVVIIMTPNPLRWTSENREIYGYKPYLPDSTRGFNVFLDDYVEKLKEIAKKKNVILIDVNHAFEDYGPEELLLDGMHPNDKGHELVCDLLFSHINDLIFSHEGV